MWKGQFLLQMVLGKLDIHMQKNEIGPYHIQKPTQNKLKTYKSWNSKVTRRKQEKLYNIDLGNEWFLGYDSKNTGNKSKNRPMGLHQTKKLYTAKKTINRMKRQPMGWEKISANHVTDKGLISKICEELKQLNIKKTTWLKYRERVSTNISQKRYEWQADIWENIHQSSRKWEWKQYMILPHTC